MNKLTYFKCNNFDLVIKRTILVAAEVAPRRRFSFNNLVIEKNI